MVGTYALTKFGGQPLPVVRAPSSANSFKADTLFGGCLILGPVGSTAPMNASSYVNVTWLFFEPAATAYMRTPTQCPLFLPVNSQSFTWDGSHGVWSFCGIHSCDQTDFTVARVNGRLVVSTGTPGQETVYSRQ